MIKYVRGIEMIWYLIIPLILIFVSLQEHVKKEHRLIYKMILSFGFLLLAISYENNTSYLIIIGLLCGVLGDLALGLKYQKLFKNICLIWGIVFFLIGHIFYYLYIIRNFEGYFISSIGITIIISLFVIKKIKQPLITKSFVSSYICLLLLVFITSVQNLLNFKKGSINYLFFIGIILFFASDLCLNQIYFKRLSPIKKSLYQAMNAILYFGGQYLIAYSLQFI